ncbi:MAG: hypothetical protein CM1200mP30_03970 [Pseudomonadota bacterium]|nr:MAG: hypothetical protein CM1200mP30_03970 [Pseudomonadota bacterium]
MSVDILQNGCISVYSHVTVQSSSLRLAMRVNFLSDKVVKSDWEDIDGTESNGPGRRNAFVACGN